MSKIQELEAQQRNCRENENTLKSAIMKSLEDFTIATVYIALEKLFQLTKNNLQKLSQNNTIWNDCTTKLIRLYEDSGANTAASELKMEITAHQQNYQIFIENTGKELANQVPRKLKKGEEYYQNIENKFLSDWKSLNNQMQNVKNITNIDVRTGLRVKIKRLKGYLKKITENHKRLNKCTTYNPAAEQKFSDFIAIGQFKIELFEYTLYSLERRLYLQENPNAPHYGDDYYPGAENFTENLQNIQKVSPNNSLPGAL